MGKAKYNLKGWGWGKHNRRKNLRPLANGTRGCFHKVEVDVEVLGLLGGRTSWKRVKAADWGPWVGWVRWLQGWLRSDVGMRWCEGSLSRESAMGGAPQGSHKQTERRVCARDLGWGSIVMLGMRGDEYGSKRTQLA